MLSRRSASAIGKRRLCSVASFAVAVLGVVLGVSPVAAETVKQQSVRLLPTTVALDQRAAAAFELKSLSALTALYADLGSQASATEAARQAGRDACGCDVAIANLRIIVGFAINKLDGQDRYQSWMQAESLKLRNDYNGFLADCATDAGAAVVPNRLQAKLVKGL